MRTWVDKLLTARLRAPRQDACGGDSEGEHGPCHSTKGQEVFVSPLTVDSSWLPAEVCSSVDLGLGSVSRG